MAFFRGDYVSSRAQVTLNPSLRPLILARAYIPKENTIVAAELRDMSSSTNAFSSLPAEKTVGYLGTR